jgi:hypothetical protein
MRQALIAAVLGFGAAVALSTVEVWRLYQGDAVGPFLVAQQRMTPPGFGPDARAGRGNGYDGQFSLLLALHLVTGEDLAAGLDLPRYRARRIALPAMAAVLAAFRAGAVPLAYLLLNALLVAAGTGAVASFAVERGHSAAWSALVVLNCGTLVSLWRATVDAGMCGFLLIAVLAASRQRWRTAAVALAAAVLAKEVAILATPCLLLAARGDRRAKLWIVVAAVVPAVWWVAVASTFPPDPVSTVAASFSLPFAGFVQSALASLRQVKPLTHALKDVFLLSIYLLAVLVGLGCGWVALRERSANPGGKAAALGAGAFALLAAFCSSAVWVEVWSYARVLLPLTLLLLMVALDRPVLGRFRTWPCLIPPSLAAIGGALFAAHLVATRTP